MDRGEMNDAEEEARYPYDEQEGDEYGEDGDDGEEEVEEEDEGEEMEAVGEEEEEEENVVQRVKEEVEEVDEQEQLQQDHAGGDDDDYEEEDEDDTDDDDEDDNVDGGGNDNGMDEDEDSERNGKKRKLRDLSLSYEFAPRVVVVPQPSAIAMSVPKSYGGRKNAAADWTEHATFVLLDTWGDKFLQLGRKSLRLDEWIEVAKKVSQLSNVVRTDTQCRNRLDTLKKKYKKEKLKIEETGNNNSSCKWVYFKKMDMLMNVSPRQPGLACGLDSREYVFTNPRVYMNHSNGLDEMRDSPGNSESTEADDDNSDGLPPKKARYVENGVERSSFRLLADSIKKFGDIHAKIENSKRQQMLELEKMRMEFHRDLELHRRKILERAQAEIAKMRDEDDEELGGSASAGDMSD
ncbi:hypothetical protein MKX03_018427 [Papaver bracteatum]|nr:hypothetical protein MKX03_018427 [Papaver bracteatum]